MPSCKKASQSLTPISAQTIGLLGCCQQILTAIGSNSAQRSTFLEKSVGGIATNRELKFLVIIVYEG